MMVVPSGQPISVSSRIFPASSFNDVPDMLPAFKAGSAAAVVRDPEEGHAAVTDFHGDFGRARVHRVFQQLLDHGRGALHHLAGGDQIGNMGG